MHLNYWVVIALIIIFFLVGYFLSEKIGEKFTKGAMKEITKHFSIDVNVNKEKQNG